jgi:hypothetical protein
LGVLGASGGLCLLEDGSDPSERGLVLASAALLKRVGLRIGQQVRLKLEVACDLHGARVNVTAGEGPGVWVGVEMGWGELGMADAEKGMQWARSNHRGSKNRGSGDREIRVADQIRVLWLMSQTLQMVPVLWSVELGARGRIEGTPSRASPTARGRPQLLTLVVDVCRRFPRFRL